MILEIRFRGDYDRIMDWIERYSGDLKRYDYIIENQEANVVLKIDMKPENAGKLLSKLEYFEED